MTNKNPNCKNQGCFQIVTWAEQKAQFKRLKKLEFDNQTIKEILPRCPKCLTAYLKNRGRLGEGGETS